MAKAPKSEAPENIETAADAPVAVDDGKTDYVIVRPAPPRIALQRVDPDQVEIRLSEVEARAELLAGHIKPKTPAAAAASSND